MSMWNQLPIANLSFEKVDSSVSPPVTRRVDVADSGSLVTVTVKKDGASQGSFTVPNKTVLKEMFTEIGALLNN